MKWGLFGGTFDPIHFGHLRAAQELGALLSLDRVIFIPAPAPPHKTEREISPFDDRLQMVRLAVAGNPLFSFSDVESHRSGKSYSVDTVRYFLKQAGQSTTLYFITGQDAFNAIMTWRQWEALLELCHFAVMTRPGYQNEGLKKILPPGLAAAYRYDEAGDAFESPSGKRVFFRKTTFLDISASDLREKIRQGQSIRYLTPDSVIAYIEEKRLYENSVKF